MPYTGIVLSFVALHAAGFLILLAYWVTSAGMFPQASRALAKIYDERPMRATLVGILTYGPLIVLFLQNGKIHNAFFRVLFVAAAIVGLLMALIGSGGLALRIGRNLSSGGDTWQQVLRGGVMLALVFVTPLLGWVLLVVGLSSGFGAVLLARPWKSKVPPIPVSAPAPVSAPTPEPALASLS